MRLAPTVVVASALVLAGPAGAAVAGGADDPTPYTVTAAGVTLPEGRTFAAHGHVNYRVAPAGGGASVQLNVHLDPNNEQPGGAYVGANAVDFDEAARRFPEGYCVTWVQVEGFDEHFGEGGQEPVCTTAPEEPETPTAPVPPGAAETPPAGVQVPDVPATPVERDAEEPAETQPAGEETRPAAPSTADGTAPSPTADAATPVTLEVEAGSASGATADAAEPTDDAALASTGTSTIVALTVGALLVVAGVALLVVRRVRRV